jgi:hypothetical protein
VTAVRLTLRTLLAYLDDMLDPAETKSIGEKVAESDAAQELIARIKQVTRRRRLTTPPATGPGSFDPNTVAEYLDNTLATEQVADVEKACLESDVHLAEIAAVHQILTLVLSQPALVPPTARQRMYGLIRGREAIPSRRARAAPRANGDSEPDSRPEEDETLLLGLPMYRRHAAWVRWLVPVAAVLLLAVIGLAIWQAIPRTTGPAVAGGTPPAGDTAKEQPLPQPPPPAPPPEEPEQLPEPAAEVVPPPPPPAEETVAKAAPPSKERGEVGRYVTQVGALPNVLLTRPAGQDRWQRLRSEGKVFTTDPLVSLPGYRSEVRLAGGVHVHLWGNLPEFQRQFPLPLLESAAVLHAPAKGFDADLTFDRGALLIANHKEKANEAARVRVRFHDEVWDLTLSEPGSEVGLTLWGRHVTPYGSGEGPHAELYCFVRKGKVGVRVRYVEHPDLQGGAVATVLFWDNKGRGLQGPTPARDPESQAFLKVWDRPPGGELARGLDEMSRRLSGATPIEVALAEVLQPGDAGAGPLHRVLAVRCLAAIDALPDLIDALGDDQKPSEVRIETVSALRHWIGRSEDQERKLFDPKLRAGALIDKQYRLAEAEWIMMLLHPFAEQQQRNPDTYSLLIELLKHEKLALRELAYFHLVHLAPAGRTIPYNPAEGTEQRERAYEQWKKLIPDGKLPPAPKP